MSEINQSDALIDLLKNSYPEVIKIEKNSKGYNWEIKVHIKDGDEATIKRLSLIDNELKMQFGGVSI